MTVKISTAPASIPHNYATEPHCLRGEWHILKRSDDTTFIFISAISYERVIKTAADGWTLEDALSFSEMLNTRTWDYLGD